MSEATKALQGTHEHRLDPRDFERLDAAVAFVRRADAAAVLAALLPGLRADEQAVIAAGCELQHAAVLVFPQTLEQLDEGLRGRGLAPGEPVASVVVRDRLSQRYQVPVHALEVKILRAAVEADSGEEREVEVFALPVVPGSELEALAAGEREHDDEAHFAIRLATPDRVRLHALRSMLADAGGMRPDGGGYNRRERATVLYFRDPEASDPLRRRLELWVPGQHAVILDAHRRSSRSAANRLLHLMTGAWRTQAIAVAAELCLADQLAASPGATVEELADATGAHAESVGRLLRYLADLGIVSPVRDGFELTEVGRLLRTDAEPPLRPLARLYGGPFYESFGHLLYAVRTGEEAFAHVFGEHHFAYFAADLELAQLFDEAMASSASMFGGVAEIIDFSLASTVVDVGGGNGELLLRILRAAPQVRGVLLERPHALKAARSTMTRAGCVDRCEFVAGDFNVAVPPGGDIYLLSRVLHDWDDDRCRVILRRCAEAMPEHAALLIVERLIPEDGSPSLAIPWDIHMLCNVGGRERTASHYARLLAAAGLQVTDRFTLPLDVVVLFAAKAAEG
jgi:DNA-binding transcriptional ArsR family regulator